MKRTGQRNFRRTVDSILGQVSQLAWRMYNQLPSYAQASVGLDDMIQHALLQVKLHEARWNPKRSGYTTFVHWVATSELQHFVQSYCVQKRYYEGVPIEVEEETAQPPTFVQYGLAKSDASFENFATYQAYSRMYDEASEESRRVLRNFIGIPFGGHVLNRGSRHLRYAAPPTSIRELRTLCIRHKLTYDNLLRISRGGVNVC